MISILTLAATFLAQQVSPPVAATTRVEGRVINSSNNAPVPKATVILRAHDPEHGQSYADESDGNGNFSFDDVEPGEYAVVVDRRLFMAEPTGATGAPPPDIKVEKGQQIKDVKIRLIPLGVIAGRVLDADGDPVRGATVNALRYVYSNGKRQLRNADSTQSGDNGEFRLFGLRAGTLYLKVTHFHQGPGGQPESITSYYPGTADETHAAPVELRAGAQLDGFDIRQLSTGVYSISFKFAEGHPPEGGLALFLVSQEGSQQFGLETFSSDSVGFKGVPPGSYEAIVRLDGGERQSYAIERVEVTNADVDGGTLTFLPAVDLAGSVRVEGGAFRGLEKVRVILQAEYRSPLLGTINAQVKPDGTFQLKNAAPSVYEVGINRVTGVYLKSVRMGDKQLTDRRIDLASKLEPLVVVLGADVGEVEGSVQNAKGDPVDAIAYGDHSNRRDLNRFTFTDQKGEFKIKDVPPGDYKVFAWEDVPVGAPQDPEFRKPFEKEATPLRMQPNGHERVSVTAIAAAQVSRSSQ
jgi:Carboxypeptidase regulatory-like domain